MFRRRLRLSAAVATGLLIAASAAVSASPVAVAAPRADDPVVEVTIGSFSPSTPKPGDPVRITGRITNTSGVTLKSPQALACIDDKRLTTAAEIEAVSTEQDLPVDKRNSCASLVNPDSTTFQLLGASLAPNASVQFQLTVPWQEWHIGERPGVYVVGVTFRGTPEDGPRLTAGRARTLMPVISTKPMPRKVNTAMMLPLLHRPTLLSGDVFANESLAQSMAPTGELGRLLKLGEKQRVTWLVDPAMLAEARKMKDGYKVVDSNNQTKPGVGQKAVQAWLNAFDASRARNPVVLLPYGDPDVASLIDAGSPLKDLVGQSRTMTEQSNLGVPFPRTGLWLENGSASSRNLAAASTGYAGERPDDVNLVTSSSWAAADRPSLLPTPLYDVSTPEGPVKSVRTVIANSALTAGGPDPASADQPLQVLQRFAAETSLLAGTGTGSATVVVAPPRNWDSSGRATAALVEGMSLPWITPVDINQVTAAKPQAAKPPAAARSKPGLTSSQLDQIKQLNSATATLRSLLVNGAATEEALRRGLFRASSYSWRGFPDEAQRFITFEHTDVTNQLGKVHLVNTTSSKGEHREIKVNLSGSKGTFPLTIANELPESVRVGIVVTSANRTDLRIDPLQTRVLAAGQKATYQINASAEQNGLIKAQAQVISADGLPVGKSQELVIQAQQYGSVGWILVGAAIALLFGTSAVRIYRRVRSERRNPSEPEPGSDPLHPAPLDPQDLASAEPVDEPGLLDPVKPLKVTPDRGNGVQGNGSTEADLTLKEGVGTKDG